MDKDKYRLLNTYSLYDGIYLGVVWTAAFACYFIGLSFPLLAQFSVMLVLCTPFFVGYRMNLFRRNAFGNDISFLQCMLYSFRVYLNGAILFGIIQYLYFKFVDNGGFLQMVMPIFQSPESMKMLQNMGYDTDQLIKLLPQIFQPFTIVLSSFIYEMGFGFFLSIITSLIICYKKQ